MIYLYGRCRDHHSLDHATEQVEGLDYDFSVDNSGSIHATVDEILGFVRRERPQWKL